MLRTKISRLIVAAALVLSPVQAQAQGWFSQNGSMMLTVRGANSTYAVTITQQNTSACSLRLVSGTTNAMTVCGTTVSFATGFVLSVSTIRIGDGTSAIPAWSFTSDTDMGFYKVSDGVLAYVTGSGVERLRLSTVGIQLGPESLNFGSAVSTNDLTLTRDAADTLAQRRGTNAQTFHIYGTYTDASNYERMFMRFGGSAYEIGTTALGTGTVRPINIITGNGTGIGFGSSSSNLFWRIPGATGHLYAQTDNTVDIGASASNRPRSIYAGTSVVAPFISFGASRSRIDGTSTDGISSFTTSAGSGVNIDTRTNGSLIVLSTGNADTATVKANALTATGTFNFDRLILSAGLPTISSGFGTGAARSHGTSASFLIDVGTGGVATGGVIGMPTASNGWSCNVTNQTAVAANRADQRTVQTASNATSVTVQNQTISTGAALAWSASDQLILACIAR